MMVTTDFHVVLRLRMSGAVPTLQYTVIAGTRIAVPLLCTARQTVIADLLFGSVSVLTGCSLLGRQQWPYIRSWGCNNIWVVSFVVWTAGGPVVWVFNIKEAMSASALRSFISNKYGGMFSFSVVLTTWKTIMINPVFLLWAFERGVLWLGQRDVYFCCITVTVETPPNKTGGSCVCVWSYTNNIAACGRSCRGNNPAACLECFSPLFRVCVWRCGINRDS
jgi:hypothetical protein